MIARNRIRCRVVAVSVGDDRLESRGVLGRDVVPWADPYVAGLIKKLQDEVRRERRVKALMRRCSEMAGDASADDVLSVF